MHNSSNKKQLKPNQRASIFDLFGSFRLKKSTTSIPAVIAAAAAAAAAPQLASDRATTNNRRGYAAFFTNNQGFRGRLRALGRPMIVVSPQSYERKQHAFARWTQPRSTAFVPEMIRGCLKVNPKVRMQGFPHFLGMRRQHTGVLLCLLAVCGFWPGLLHPSLSTY